jgi:hypothetical protein
LTGGAGWAAGVGGPGRASVEFLLTTEWAAGNPFPTQQLGRRCRPSLRPNVIVFAAHAKS